MNNKSYPLRNRSSRASRAHKADHTQRSDSKQQRISASSLLSLFKARPSASSVSQMARSGQIRCTLPVSYTEGDDSDDAQTANASTPKPSALAKSSSPSYSDAESERDVRSDVSVLSNINVTMKQQTVSGPPEVGGIEGRALPARSTRAKVNYALRGRLRTPKEPKKKSLTPWILKSDTMNDTPAKPSKSAKPVLKPDTARNRVRDEIATKTKSKRDAYLFHHKHYFLPLLPDTNYITKLANSDIGAQNVAPYQQLQNQPQQITAIMKPYQLKGLSFLATMYRNGMSAILGDEMGLGKTLQTIALIQYLEETHPSPPGISRPYLVVCPLSVLESWYNECRKWAPKLRPMRFHGNASEREHLKKRAMGNVDRYGNETMQSKKRKSKRQSTSGSRRGQKNDDTAGFDILITTYEVFVAEQGFFKHAFVWRYIILDEGHKIKNEKSNVSHALQSLTAEHRLLLTGTPLQNNLREMWALLHWLYPDVFTDKTADKFAEAFDLGQGKISTAFMDNARRLLELIMIRRLKNSPGVNLDLPAKSEVLLYVPLTPLQRFWYTRLLTKAGNSMIDTLFTGIKQKELDSLQAEYQDDNVLSELEKAITTTDQWAESRQIMQRAIEDDAAGDKDTNSYKKLLNLVMQLRKCCVHPYQIKGASPDPYILGNHIIHASGKFLVLSKLVDELVVKQKKKILIFSGFTSTLDYCEDLLALKGANQHQGPFSYLRLDGGTARAKRNLDIRLFNDQSSDFRVMLISTRAGGLGLNLTAASEIVFLDEDWNPQVTLQAEARAHRIGQTKPVTIYKICTQGTVEEQMMGRIRKKLYLSAKITESMRDIHSTPEPSSRKRKRGVESVSNTSLDEDAPQLGVSQLMSLVRRGAATLTHPEIDVNEMLSWDFQTIIEKCKDRPADLRIAEQATGTKRSVVSEEEWLAKMERVECAVLDGVKYQRQVDMEASKEELSRSDRRHGKNTTVMIGGFAINKESLQCADWEAVPTLAGKDPRLAEPKKERAPPIQHQDYCQVCHDGGEVIICSGCPRVYHMDCLGEASKAKIERRTMGFHCSQHQCFDCEKNTAEAGGLIYRCRWCDKGYCEDCLDWDEAKLLGDTLAEYDILGYISKNAWYVECHSCLNAAREDPSTATYLDSERTRIAHEHEGFLQQQAAAELLNASRLEDIIKSERDASTQLPPSREETMTEATTLDSSGGATTPRGIEPARKKRRANNKAIGETLSEDSIGTESRPATLLTPFEPNTGAAPEDTELLDFHPSTNRGFLRHKTTRKSDENSREKANAPVTGPPDKQKGTFGIRSLFRSFY